MLKQVSFALLKTQYKTTVSLRLCAMLLLFGATTFAQTKPEVLKDPKNGRVVFKGPVTFDDLQKEPSFDWLKSGADKYHPRHRKVNALKEHLAEYSIIIFMGTWCSDTHDMLPKFFKVLQETGYPMAQVTMYGVERNKETRSADVKQYNVTSIPTIVVLNKGGKEVGRITERVDRSVEGDLVRIIGR
ncbi:MAG: thioredoxin family protein [Flavipsychrobacter sp.]|jgi:thiol-disulfide isomerase/thioredoxin|nr:thioredoxin family protein [Flavipsychrobacter sp.]